MKAKTGSKLLFIGRWLFGHALLAMLISIMWMNMLPVPLSTGFVLEGITWTVLLAMQYVLLPYQWRPKLRNWFIGSGIGWIIGMIALQFLIFNAGISERVVIYLINIVPVAIAQWLILRERFKHSWIWAMALVIGTITQAILENAVLNDVWVTTMFTTVPMIVLTVAIHTIIPSIKALITGIGFVTMSQSLKQDDNLRLDDEMQRSRRARLEETHSMDNVEPETFVTRQDAASSA